MKNSSAFIPRSIDSDFPGEITKAKCVNFKLLGTDSLEVTNSDSFPPHFILHEAFKTGAFQIFLPTGFIFELSFAVSRLSLPVKFRRGLIWLKQIKCPELHIKNGQCHKSLTHLGLR